MSSSVDAPGTALPNLSSDAFWAAPLHERAAAFAELRRREPVAFFPELPTWSDTPGPGYWALTRLDDLRAASRDSATFINGPGYVIDDMPPRFYEFFVSALTNFLRLSGFALT